MTGALRGMRIKPLLFCLAAGVAACVGINDDVLTTPDAGTEIGVSGAALDGAEPSPPDVALEYLVIGLIFVGVGGSVRSRRRPEAKVYEI